MRAPEFEPSLDLISVPTLTDPEPASIRHLQRVDRRVHALYTGWGGNGIWVPTHMTQTESPDDLVIPLRLPPGVEYFYVRALVSQRDKSAASPCKMVLTSTATASTCELQWVESTAGDVLQGAFEVASAGGSGEPNKPLQCRSGTAWTWGLDTVTVQFDTGKGTVWGICFQPIHTPR